MRGARPRVLVVDDDEDALAYVCGLLDAAGYETAGAEDGLRALSCLAAAPVDLVLSDVEMPRLDGLGLLASMRAAGHEEPVVLMSATRGHDASSAGASAFVAKPCSARALSATLARVLRRPARPRGAS